MNGITYSIKKYNTDDQGRVRYIKYNIHHHGQNRPAGLEQDLELRCSKSGRWTTTMTLNGMLGQPSAQEAITKMAVWLETMTMALMHLHENLDKGLNNPIQDDRFTYTRDGLIKKLATLPEPLDPLTDENDFRL